MDYSTRNTSSDQLKNIFCTPECSPVPSEPGTERSPSPQKMHPSPQLMTLNEPLDLSHSTRPKETPMHTHQLPILIPNTLKTAPYVHITTPPMPTTRPQAYLTSSIHSPHQPPEYTNLSPPCSDCSPKHCPEPIKIEPVKYSTSTSPDICNMPSPTSTSTHPSDDPQNLLLGPLHPNYMSPKTTRPFKAYPKDPIVMSSGARTYAEACLQRESISSYVQFRERMINQMHPSHPGAISNPKMRRNSRNGDQHADGKDQAYWERRRKNNEAAKRSRDARRAKEDEIAIRAAYLEHENQRLTTECAALQAQLAEIHAQTMRQAER